VLDGVHWFAVRRCESLFSDIGFDIRNNGFLSEFNTCTTNLGTSTNVGILLRGATGLTGGAIAGSGSDIQIRNCQMSGAHAGAWCEPNGGGYHFIGGQLTGGANATVNDDGAGCLVTGKSYTSQDTLAAAANNGDTTLSVNNGATWFSSGAIQIGNGPTSSAGPTITYTGKTGNTLTGVTGITGGPWAIGTELRLVGDAPSVTLSEGCSTEGCRRAWVWRSYSGGQSTRFSYTNHLGQPWPNSPLGFMKITRGIWNVHLEGLRLTGSYQGATDASQMMTLTGESNSLNFIEEVGTNGAIRLNNTTTFTFDSRPMVVAAGLVQAWARYSDNQYHGAAGLSQFTSDASHFQTWDYTANAWRTASGPAIKRWQTGTGAPATGLEGELYIDGPTKTLYGPHTSGTAWGTGVTLGGAVGANGSVKEAIGVVLPVATSSLLPAGSQAVTTVAATPGLWSIRVVCPVAGSLRNVAIWSTVASGNMMLGVYDTGDAAGGAIGTRTLLGSSGSTTATANTWKIWDPGGGVIPVTKGQQLDLVVTADNVTSTFGRIVDVTTATGWQWPTGYNAVPGGALPKLSWWFQLGSFALPATITEATAAMGSTHAPLILAQVI
jgi:hypothetical protein